MIYTVGWTRHARNVLASLWINAPDQAAVSAASNAIDRTLRIDAHRQGVPHGGGRRLLRIPPLVVVFTVDPGDCKATVLQVGRTT